jgi:hypothetical protein
MNLECRLTSLASKCDCHEKKHKRVNDFVKRFLLLGALVGLEVFPGGQELRERERNTHPIRDENYRMCGRAHMRNKPIAMLEF